jgi:hypothetical protein
MKKLINRIKAVIKYLFIPHENNQWRAKYIQHDFLTSLILVLLVLNIGLRFAVKNYPTNILGENIDISVEVLLNYTNAERTQHGLAPLQLNPNLVNAAADKAAHIFANNYWSHFAPDGTSPWFFFQKNNYPYIYAGENLAKDFTSTKDVVQAWMNSPTHRENILKAEYQEIGFAVMEGNLQGENTILIVQLFGTQEATTLAASTPLNTNTTAPEEVETEVTEQTMPTLTPTPSVQIVKTISNNQPPPSSFYKTRSNIIKKTALIDISSLQKYIVVSALLGLSIVLALDFYITKKNKVFKLSGKHVAHLMFTLLLILSIIATNPGVIL